VYRSVQVEFDWKTVTNNERADLEEEAARAKAGGRK
jgi:hypothetical protein